MRNKRKEREEREKECQLNQELLNKIHDIILPKKRGLCISFRVNKLEAMEHDFEMLNKNLSVLIKKIKCIEDYLKISYKEKDETLPKYIKVKKVKNVKT